MHCRRFKISLPAAALLVSGGLSIFQTGSGSAQEWPVARSQIAAATGAEAAMVDDIVGLRPGMSYAEIVAILEAREGTRTIETAEQWIRQSHGIPTRQLLRASDGIACAVDEKASRTRWHTVCDTRGGRFQARKEITDEILVAFTGMPDAERACSIWRHSVFAKDRSPTVTALVEALTEKYGKPHVYQTEAGYYSMSHRKGATNLNWVYGPTGDHIQGNDSLLSKCVNGPKPWFGTQHSWSGGCGLTIRAEILPVPDSTLLAQELNVTVVHQKNLIEALGRFDAELKAAVEQHAQGAGAKPEL